MQLADLPQGYARQLDDCGGVQSAAAWRLLMDQMDQMDLMDNVGRHEIPRGFAGRCLVWLGARLTAG